MLTFRFFAMLLIVLIPGCVIPASYFASVLFAFVILLDLLSFAPAINAHNFSVLVYDKGRQVFASAFRTSIENIARRIVICVLFQ